MLQLACPLIFDPELHEYRLTGVLVPSVTQVLRQTGYIDLSDVPADTLEAARERGRRVHQALHYLLEDDLAAHVVRAIRMEFRVWSQRYACAGTADLLALHDDGSTSIDDFKSGHPDDVSADLQTAAYHGFALEMASTDRELFRDLMGGDAMRLVRRRSIRLFADGRPAQETVYGDYRDYGRFLNALTVVHDQWKRPAPMAWDEER
jgi:hypothetical protein